MPRSWKTVVDGDETYTELDCQQAMSQLIHSQCLYLRHPRQGVAYRLISLYRKDFAEAVELMGLELGFNPDYSYCYVRQKAAKHPYPMELQESFFLLTLLKAYHMRASSGDLDDQGSAMLSIEDFDTLFKEVAKRDFDKRGSALKELLRSAKQQGLAAAIDPPDGDPQPFAIEILAGIADILTAGVLHRFGAEMKSASDVAEAKIAQVSAP